jgi:outer membrane protein OmpU
MKKILFATTALVATASVAAADVSFSGYAALGVAKVGNASAEVQHNVDLYISASTESDNGASFYAGMDYENNETTGDAGKGSSGFESTGSRVGMKSGAFTIEFGNVDGAADKRTTEAHRLFAGIDFEFWGGVDNDDNNNILRADYAMGDVAVSISNSATDNATGLGVSYSMGQLGLGLGYEGSDDGDIMTVSAGYDMGAIGVRAIMWQGSGTGADSAKDQLDVSAQYSVDNFTLGLRSQMNNEIDVNVVNAFATYNLGGGVNAFVQAGQRISASAAQDVATAGIQFNF